MRYIRGIVPMLFEKMGILHIMKVEIKRTGTQLLRRQEFDMFFRKKSFDLF